MIKKVLGKGSFNIDVYSVKVHVYIMSTPREVSKKVKEFADKLNVTVGELPTQCYGFTVAYTKQQTDYYLFYANPADVNNITHETYHLTEFIEQFRSLKQDENKEASANLNGFINSKVFEIFHKNNLEIHDGIRK